MGIINTIKETVSPTPTEDQVREKEIMKKYRLKKDPVVPHRYWIDDQKTINFNPGSKVSCDKAVAKLEETFNNPQITEQPKGVQERGPYGPKGKASGGSGILAKLEPAIRNVSEGTDREFREEIGGFDPKKIEKEMMSTGGANYDPMGYKDFLGDAGSNYHNDYLGDLPAKKKKGGK
jgi:hypothetical protein